MTRLDTHQTPPLPRLARVERLSHNVPNEHSSKCVGSGAFCWGADGPFDVVCCCLARAADFELYVAQPATGPEGGFSERRRRAAPPPALSLRPDDARVAPAAGAQPRLRPALAWLADPTAPPPGARKAPGPHCGYLGQCLEMYCGHAACQRLGLLGHYKAIAQLAAEMRLLLGCKVCFEYGVYGALERSDCHDLHLDTAELVADASDSSALVLEHLMHNGLDIDDSGVFNALPRAGKRVRALDAPPVGARRRSKTRAATPPGAEAATEPRDDVSVARAAPETRAGDPISEHV